MVLQTLPAVLWGRAGQNLRQSGVNSECAYRVWRQSFRCPFRAIRVRGARASPERCINATSPLRAAKNRSPGGACRAVYSPRGNYAGRGGRTRAWTSRPGRPRRMNLPKTAGSCTRPAAHSGDRTCAKFRHADGARSAAGDDSSQKPVAYTRQLDGSSAPLRVCIIYLTANAADQANYIRKNTTPGTRF